MAQSDVAYSIFNESLGVYLIDYRYIYDNFAIEALLQPWLTPIQFLDRGLRYKDQFNTNRYQIEDKDIISGGLNLAYIKGMHEFSTEIYSGYNFTPSLTQISVNEFQLIFKHCHQFMMRYSFIILDLLFSTEYALLTQNDTTYNVFGVGTEYELFLNENHSSIFMLEYLNHSPWINPGGSTDKKPFLSFQI